MRYNVISYLIEEGIKNVLKNKKSTSACIGTMIAAMFIFGIFLAIGQNVEHIMNNVQEAQGMQVFLGIDATEEEIEEVKKELENIDEINTIKFVDKDAALDTVKEMYNRGSSDTEKILEGISKDILPVSFMITFTDLTKASEVKAEILKNKLVTEVRSSEPTIAKLISITNGIRVFTAVILIILVIISIFIISNTIKLTVHARRKEISIMKYVGATNSFIRWPFMIEGMIIGIVASLLSILIIGVGYNVFAEKIVSQDFIAKLNISLLTFNDMFRLIAIVYIALGVGIGIIGSSMSMKKYLKV